MLADLVPVVLATKMQPATRGRSEAQRKYRQKNRAKLRAYKRAWYAKRKPKNV